MMLPQDALVLAVTKLKTRRVRLFVTIIVGGILFVLLASLSLIANGAFKSVESFSQEGLGSRYILQVSSPGDVITSKLQTDPEAIAEAKSLFDQYKKDKVAVAKELGVTYDPAVEQSPVTTNPDASEVLDTSSKIGVQVAAPRIKASDESFYAGYQKTVESYAPKATYSSVTVGSQGFLPSNVNYTIAPIVDGKESQTEDTNNFQYESKGIETIRQGFSALSDQLLEEFLLPDQTLVAEEGVIPIVAPFSVGESILELSPLNVKASTDERLERIQYVRENAAGATFAVCLRNQTSIDRQLQATAQALEIEAGKSKKDYLKPDVVYEQSATPCEDVQVTRDVRTATQKKTDAKNEEFEARFGAVPATQRVVTFKIVGLAADPPSFQSFKVTDILGAVLNTNLGGGWFVPLSAQVSLPEYASDFAKAGTSTDYIASNYVEFKSADEARTFMDERSCEPAIFEIVQGVDPFADCLNKNMYFIYPFGSSSIALEQIRDGFKSVFPKILFVVAIISALIMMGTVGKIIADSRRETAVFRAIGAKRLDIAQIYVTYTILLALLLTIFALSFGWLLASFVDNRYSADFTVEAIVSFNAKDMSREFTLIGADWQQLLRLVAIIFVGSIASALLPLLSNLRRNPIKDMRDER